ncbi:MAG: carbon-nitrogen hydrolase family protein [Pseudomonadota bacterium]|nr:carbon-nitrogen hydrolase family protein [Pseudomonadota bacterium]MDE3038150.1 carbon-nitrogen hydrolase family protein [Pseudomonadota bacterium]
MIIKVALVQLTSTADMAENIAGIEAFVAKAAGQGAELVALPENAFYMRAEGEAPAPRYTQEEHPGVVASAKMARQRGIWLLAGSVAVIGKSVDHKTYNRSLLFNPEGRIAAQYDKIHLFDVDVGDGQAYKESAKMLPGEKAVVAELPWCRLGMTICYDLRFPQLYRALAKAGAQILAVPSAFTQTTGEAHWHVLLRARAIENACFVIAPAQTGTHPGGRKTYGHSLVVDPWGKVLADGGTEEGVILAEVDLDEVGRVRAKLPSLEHDREFQ